MMGKWIAGGLLFAYLAVLLDLTLVRYRTEHAVPNFVPLRTIEHDVRAGGEEFRVNILGNLAATAPLGLLVPILMGGRASVGRVAAISFGISFLIETAQGISGQRVADVDDLALNTLGGLIGYAPWGAWRWFRGREPGAITPRR